MIKRRDLLLGIASAAATVAAGQGPVATPSSRRSYTTRFAGNEEPLSENGAWSNVGLDWTAVRKVNGIACGTLTGKGGYDDSYARLSGFGPDQTAAATIYLNPRIDRSCVHEVEILLRWEDAPHRATGYECNLAFDGHYCEIVSWNGAKGDFTKLARGKIPTVRNGDVLKAVAAGNVITVYVNDVEVTRATDTRATRHPAGNPGIGFFRQPCGVNADYGFSSFTATSA